MIESGSYDICTDYNVLLSAVEKLGNINNALNNSILSMLQTLQISQGFLSGKQFEKAYQTTTKCIELTGLTVNNTQNAMDYLKNLMDILEQYSQCKYTEA